MGMFVSTYFLSPFSYVRSIFQVFAQFSQHEFPKLMNLNISFTAANQETLLGLSFIMKACPFLEKLVLQVNILVDYIQVEKFEIVIILVEAC